MFDAKKLLDALLGGGTALPQSGPAGLGNALGQAAGDPQSGAREGEAGTPVADRSFGSIIGQVLQEAASGLKDVAREVEARTGVATRQTSCSSKQRADGGSATFGLKPANWRARTSSLSGQQSLVSPDFFWVPDQDATSPPRRPS